MNETQRQFLSLFGRPPFRLTPQQTAWILNCMEHDIPILVGARLLKPLGSPAPNGAKFFSTAEVLELAGDSSWLHRMTKTIQCHWRRKNQMKSTEVKNDPQTMRKAFADVHPASE